MRTLIHKIIKNIDSQQSDSRESNVELLSISGDANQNAVQKRIDSLKTLLIRRLTKQRQLVLTPSSDDPKTGLLTTGEDEDTHQFLPSPIVTKPIPNAVKEDSDAQSKCLLF